MEYTYVPRGVCSKKITFEIESGAIKNVKYEGGCNGNLQGIASLVEGMPASDVKERLSGIKCGNKSTSCPDQLARAIAEAAGA